VINPFVDPEGEEDDDFTPSVAEATTNNDDFDDDDDDASLLVFPFHDERIVLPAISASSNITKVDDIRVVLGSLV